MFYLKSLILLLMIITGLVMGRSVLAAEQFSASYNVTYDVDQAGLTSVTENIAVKNLTDQFFASNYQLNVSGTKVSEVSAFDSQGPLDTQVSIQGGKSVITVKFNQQVVGKDKVYNWTLKFKSTDYVEIQGQVWRISLPKAPKINPDDDYQLTLIVPVSLGDPSKISPTPIRQSEANSQIYFRFSKTQLSTSGVLAYFGSEQTYNFDLKYDLENKGILPQFISIPIPSNNAYQDVLITKIIPEPDNVVVDQDGNFIAYFQVRARNHLLVSLFGQAKLHFKPNQAYQVESTDILSKLTREQRYWEVSNPLIKERVNQVLESGGIGPKKQLSVSDKARLIDRFVSAYLNFDQKRLEAKNFSRLGALTVLNNPDQALASEYSDLFVTLCRAANIPARRLEGFAISSNQQLRPWSLGGSMHAWAEFYDPDKGWMMVDPTWESTSNGVDYFGQFDIDHLVIATQGLSSIDPTFQAFAEVGLSDQPLNGDQIVNLSIDSVNELIAGVPSVVHVLVENRGSSAFAPTTLMLESPDLYITDDESTHDLTVGVSSLDRTSIAFGKPTTSQSGFYRDKTEILVPTIPPFGHVKLDLTVRSKGFLTAKDANLKVSYQDHQISRQFWIKPFYQYTIFNIGLLILILSTVLMYLASIIIHWRTGSVRVKKGVKHKL